MITLVKSDHLGSLAEEFAEQLSGLNGRDPLQPVPVIVPNQDMGRWLTIQLAEQMGIAMNLEMILPADWQWRQIRAVYPDLPKVTVSDRYPLYWSLFELFQDLDFVKSIPPVYGYIFHDLSQEANGNLSLPSRSRLERSSQIALQIASLFDKYLNNRPGMLLDWQRGRGMMEGMDGPGVGHAEWQSLIWNRLCEHWRVLYDDERCFHKAELWEKACNHVSEMETGADLFLFNPGLFPAPIMELLQKYGIHQKVSIYQVFPSVQGRVDGEHSVLNNLGKEIPKLEKLYSQYDKLLTLPPPKSSANLLGRIKESWSNPEPVAHIDASIGEDHSVQIRSCHSPLREMEILQIFLTSRFEEDETLHPDDILVVTPDLQTYASAIEAVFGSEEEGVPAADHTTGLGRSGYTRESYQALEVLLTLLDSRFALADVIDLFSMNPVMQRLSVRHSQIDQLKTWLEENAVYWGLDENHRKLEGQPQERLHTWREALRRIWFGILAGGEQGDRVMGSLIYPGLTSTEDRETIGCFTNALFDLEAMMFQKRTARSVSEWCDWLGGWVDQFMDESSVSQIRSLLDRIQTEAEMSQLKQEVPYSIFKRHLKSRTNHEAAGSAVFTKGILFSSMVPVRNLPYRIVALVGLNEESYPRKAIESEMDIMAYDPHVTDRDRRDEDRQMFLESIFAARDVHYVSFVGQDKRDNEEKAISPIISEWVTYLSEKTGTDVNRWVKKEPLSAFSLDHFRNTSDAPVYSGVAATVADRLHRNGVAMHGFSVTKSFSMPETGERIQLHELVSFFKNPYQGFVRKQLETTLMSTDVRPNEFGVNTLETYTLFETLLQSFLKGKDLKQVTEMLLISGSLPAGYPGVMKMDELKTYVNEAVRVLRDVGESFGDCVFVREVKISFPIDVDGRHIIIDGSVPFYMENTPLTVQQSGMSGKWAMHHWIQHLALLCQRDQTHQYSVLHSLKKKPGIAAFAVPDNYKEMFQDLVSYYLQFLTKPENAFLHASYAYAEQLQKNQDEMKALEMAQAAFEADDFGMSFDRDLQDPYTLRLVGKDRPFDPSFVDNPFARHVQTMTRFFDADIKTF